MRLWAFPSHPFFTNLKAVSPLSCSFSFEGQAATFASLRRTFASHDATFASHDATFATVNV
jgi:hypothetical protein